VPGVGWEDVLYRRSRYTTPAMSARQTTHPTTLPAIAPASVFFSDDDGGVLGVVEPVA